MKWKAYWRLMRFDKPAGTLLLWYPTMWALWSSNGGPPPILLIVLTFLGTVFMRAAGCVINDIADRQVDKHVARTALRPLTSNELSIIEAWLVFIALLFFSFLIVIQLNQSCFYIALIALAITAFYPFCKRFFDAPQLILGLAFSMGIPMAYAASAKSLDHLFYLLFLINFIWIISYDTMYAMADKVDDIRIGVKSTALLFASYDRLVIALLKLSIQILWILWANLIEASYAFYLLWFFGSLISIYQQQLIYQRQSDDCLKAFKVSVYYGAAMSLAVILAFTNDLFKGAWQ